ncbi:MAG: Gfo/Idh/MocA family oxidoreductase [Candidatus Sulfotelmatobacter sp.]
MIGVGMQGSGLLSGAITIPGVECVAAADLYDGRHTLAKEITGNTSLPTTRHYQELLDRKDIDCIVAAVPDHWHRRVVVDACNAGKDIYCEKPMSHTVADGFAMVEAAQKNNRDWRGLDDRAHAGPQRSHWRVGVSAAPRSFTGDSRLGYLAQRCTQD